jgi:hypothetical protein
MTAQEESDVDDLNNLISSLNNDIQLLSADTIVPYDSFIINQIVNLQEQMSDYYAQLNTIINNVNSRAMSNAIALKSSLTSLPTPYDFNLAYIDIRKLQLDYIIEGPNSFDAADIALINDISSLCGDNYGIVPLLARSLQSLLGLTEGVEVPCSERRERTTSIELANDVTLRIMPNPAISSITVLLPNNNIITEISITDITGKTVKDYKINDEVSEYKINISELKNGMYIIKVNDKYSSKFIKID